MARLKPRPTTCTSSPPAEQPQGEGEAHDEPRTEHAKRRRHIHEAHALQHGMVGRFSAIIGPIIWAAVSVVTVRHLGMSPARGQGVGVLVLMSMVLIAYWILRPVSDARVPRHGAAQ